MIIVTQKDMEIEERRQKALRICALYADEVPIRKACQLEELSVSKFFEVKRQSPDVQKAFIDAKEVLAELRVGHIDEMRDQMLSGELDKDIFSAAVKSDQWVITKLRPDMFGTRTTVDVSGNITHTPAMALAKMSDEQILQLASLPALPSTDSISADEPVEAVYEEIGENDNKGVDTEGLSIYNDNTAYLDSNEPNMTEGGVSKGSFSTPLSTTPSEQSETTANARGRETMTDISPKANIVSLSAFGGKNEQ